VKWSVLFWYLQLILIDFINLIFVSYSVNGFLLYCSLGSGIKRALEQWPDIDFDDDREGCRFTVTVHRKVAGGAYELKSSPKSRRSELLN